MYSACCLYVLPILLPNAASQVGNVHHGAGGLLRIHCPTGHQFWHAPECEKLVLAAWAHGRMGGLWLPHLCITSCLKSGSPTALFTTTLPRFSTLPKTRVTGVPCAMFHRCFVPCCPNQGLVTLVAKQDADMCRVKSDVPHSFLWGSTVPLCTECLSLQLCLVLFPSISHHPPSSIECLFCCLCSNWQLATGMRLQ